MNANKRESGIVRAVMTAARTLTRKKISTTRTRIMPRMRFHSTVSVVIFLRSLEAVNAEARRVADVHAADILNANRRAVVAADDDFANVVGGFDEAKTANVVKLSTLRIKTAAGVGIIGL